MPHRSRTHQDPETPNVCYEDERCELCGSAESAEMVLLCGAFGWHGLPKQHGIEITSAIRHQLQLVSGDHSPLHLVSLVADI